MNLLLKSFIGLKEPKVACTKCSPAVHTSQSTCRHPSFDHSRLKPNSGGLTGPGDASAAVEKNEILRVKVECYCTTVFLDFCIILLYLLAPDF